MQCSEVSKPSSTNNQLRNAGIQGNSKAVPGWGPYGRSATGTRSNPGAPCCSIRGNPSGMPQWGQRNQLSNRRLDNCATARCTIAGDYSPGRHDQPTRRPNQGFPIVQMVSGQLTRNHNVGRAPRWPPHRDRSSADGNPRCVCRRCLGTAEAASLPDLHRFAFQQSTCRSQLRGGPERLCRQQLA